MRWLTRGRADLKVGRYIGLKVGPDGLKDGPDSRRTQGSGPTPQGPGGTRRKAAPYVLTALLVASFGISSQAPHSFTRRRRDDRRDAEGDGGRARHLARSRSAVAHPHRPLRGSAQCGDRRQPAGAGGSRRSATASVRREKYAARFTASRSRSRTTSTRSTCRRREERWRSPV